MIFKQMRLEWFTKSDGECETNEGQLHDDQVIATVAQVDEESLNENPKVTKSRLPLYRLRNTRKLLSLLCRTLNRTQSLHVRIMCIKYHTGRSTQWRERPVSNQSTPTDILWIKIMRNIAGNLDCRLPNNNTFTFFQRKKCIHCFYDYVHQKKRRNPYRALFCLSVKTLFL